MSVKRNILQAIVLGFTSVLVVSCVKEGTSQFEVSGTPVRFTRATTKALSFAENSTIGVYSFWHEDGAETGLAYRANQKLTYDGSLWNYDAATYGGHPMYWPLSDADKLSFYAYGPYSASETSSGIVTMDIGPSDVVWANTINNSAPGTQLSRADVNMLFEHCLAQLKLNFDRNGWEADRIVSNIQISGAFPHRADLNVKTGSWEDASLPASPIAFKGEFGIDDDDAEMVICYMMPGVSTLVFDLTIPASGAKAAKSLSVTANFPAAVEAGKSYILNFNFATLHDPTDGGVGVEISEWDPVDLSTSIGGYSSGYVNGVWTYEDWTPYTVPGTIGGYGEQDPVLGGEYGNWEQGGDQTVEW